MSLWRLLEINFNTIDEFILIESGNEIIKKILDPVAQLKLTSSNAHAPKCD